MKLLGAFFFILLLLLFLFLFFYLNFIITSVSHYPPGHKIMIKIVGLQ